MKGRIFRNTIVLNNVKYTQGKTSIPDEVKKTLTQETLDLISKVGNHYIESVDDITEELWNELSKTPNIILQVDIDEYNKVIIDCDSPESTNRMVNLIKHLDQSKLINTCRTTKQGCQHFIFNKSIYTKQQINGNVFFSKDTEVKLKSEFVIVNGFEPSEPRYSYERFKKIFESTELLDQPLSTTNLFDETLKNETITLQDYPGQNKRSNSDDWTVKTLGPILKRTLRGLQGEGHWDHKNKHWPDEPLIDEKAIITTILKEMVHAVDEPDLNNGKETWCQTKANSICDDTTPWEQNNYGGNKATKNSVKELSEVIHFYNKEIYFKGRTGDDEPGYKPIWRSLNDLVKWDKADVENKGLYRLLASNLGLDKNNVKDIEKVKNDVADKTMSNKKTAINQNILIHFRNGYLDKNFTFVPDENAFSISQLGFDYNASFLNDVKPELKNKVLNFYNCVTRNDDNTFNEARRDSLLAVCGSCFSRISEAIFCWLWSSEGAAGKGTIFDIMIDIAEIDKEYGSIQHRETDKFLGKNTENSSFNLTGASNLTGILFDESGKNLSVSATSNLKRKNNGNKRQSNEEKGKTQKQVSNMATMVISSNYRPDFNVMNYDDGLQQRLVIINMKTMKDCKQLDKDAYNIVTSDESKLVSFYLMIEAYKKVYSVVNCKFRAEQFYLDCKDTPDFWGSKTAYLDLQNIVTDFFRGQSDLIETKENVEIVKFTTEKKNELINIIYYTNIRNKLKVSDESVWTEVIQLYKYWGYECDDKNWSEYSKDTKKTTTRRGYRFKKIIKD